MAKEFLGKLKESTISILPIVLLIIILNFANENFRLDSGSLAGANFTSFCISIVPLILGMTLFNMGADKAMGKIGDVVGSTLTKKKSLVLLVVIAVLLGTLMTIAEPDLTVLSQRLFPSGPNWILIVIAALGVGIMLAVAVVRVILQKSLKVLIITCYCLVFALACIADENLIPVVFDSGGATTSAISSPFILAFGAGISQVRGGKNAEDDSFGYAGLASLGPLITVMLLAIFMDENYVVSNLGDEVDSITTTLASFSELGPFYADTALSALEDVTISILPIVVFFFIYNFWLKLKGKELLSIVIGLLYTYIGLVIFLIGANAGFIPVASTLGANFVNVDSWVFMIFGFAVGCLIILAEPAVHVLGDQVAEITRGTIRKNTVMAALAVSTGVAVLLNVIRVLYNIPIMYFIVPIYMVAFILMFIVPNIYVAVAFDSTGVATGTMSSCFLLPMFIGYTATSSGGDMTTVLTDGFGVIGMISTMPLIAIESLGLYNVIKNRRMLKKTLARVKEPDDNQIIHLKGSVVNNQLPAPLLEEQSSAAESASTEVIHVRNV